MELQYPSNDPPVAGILIQEIPVAEGSAEGYVVCMIPESASKPHRAEFAGKRFFLRIGSTSNDCSVSLLRQLFYPKKIIRLEAIMVIKPVPKNMSFTKVVDGLPVQPRCTIDVSIANNGYYSIQEVRASASSETHWLATYSRHGNGYEITQFDLLRELGTIHPICINTFHFLAASQNESFPQEIKIRVFSRDTLPFFADVKCPQIFNEEARVQMVTPNNLNF
jgi:hypothetical protein